MKHRLFYKSCCGCREEIIFWVMLVVEMGGQVGTHRDGTESLDLLRALKGAWTYSEV